MSTAHGYWLETSRLGIRPFLKADFERISAILDASFGEEPAEDRQAWLEWSIRNNEQLAALYQPPYGDRAVILKDTQTLIGTVGIVPCFGPFFTLKTFQNHFQCPEHRFNNPQFGLYWATHPEYRKQGYAAEAAQAVIDFLFNQMNIACVVATTDHQNSASVAVMRHLHMTVETNPYPEPEWFQTIGVLFNPAAK